MSLVCDYKPAQYLNHSILVHTYFMCIEYLFVFEYVLFHLVFTLLVWVYLHLSYFILTLKLI